jgi:GDPmannose 4,6-dehydratase
METILPKNRVALITGINGQDGSYLTELLLEKGYVVWGIIRRSSSINTARIDHLYNNSNMNLRYGDLGDGTSLYNVINEIKQTHFSFFNEQNQENLETMKQNNRFEIYNLGAMSHVLVSFKMAEYTGDIDAIGTLRLLNAIRTSGLMDITRFYQASTSELYGKVVEIPQTEDTPFYPRSPYGVAKLYAHWITKNYREAYNMYACCGILFNHESPRRGATFVTRKITIALGNIVSGKQDVLVLGNLDSKRDWGHAKDYVEGMWRMLQQPNGEVKDYILSTNETHTVREFVEKAFLKRGIEIAWTGEGIHETGFDKNTGQTRIRISDTYFRPTEVDLLIGNSSKARRELGWIPKYSFDNLIDEMVAVDSPQ